MAQRKAARTVETLTHGEAVRKNIPTAEYQAVMERSELKKTRKGNLFVIFGEPDIDILPVGGEGAEESFFARHAYFLGANNP